MANLSFQVLTLTVSLCCTYSLSTKVIDSSMSLGEINIAFSYFSSLQRFDDEKYLQKETEINFELICVTQAMGDNFIPAFTRQWMRTIKEKIGMLIKLILKRKHKTSFICRHKKYLDF